VGSTEGRKVDLMKLPLYRNGYCEKLRMLYYSLSGSNARSEEYRAEEVFTRRVVNRKSLLQSGQYGKFAMVYGKELNL
jgi:hypothetical protein